MLTTFTALAEPNRLRMVELLLGGAQSVGTIGERLGLMQPQVSKHLRVLKDAGLVDVEPRGQQRLYALKPAPLRELDAWLAPYRRFWSARLDALEARLAQVDPPRPRRRRRSKR
jgi:DNA-binding transcriptional ArsR family regulator